MLNDGVPCGIGDLPESPSAGREKSDFVVVSSAILCSSTSSSNANTCIVKLIGAKHRKYNEHGFLTDINHGMLRVLPESQSGWYTWLKIAVMRRREREENFHLLALER